MQLIVGYVFDGPYKVDLPEAILAEVGQSDIDSPIIYEIGLPSSGSSRHQYATHVGVREFSAPPDTIGLNSNLARQIGAEIGSCVVLKQKSLPKGSEVTMKMSTGNLDWKSILERWIPQNVTALSVGDKLQVSHLNEEYLVTVTKLEPESAVCVTDTDIDLLIEAPTEFDSSPGPRSVTLNEEFELGPDTEVEIDLGSIDPTPRSINVSMKSGVLYVGPKYATSPVSYLHCFTGSGNHTLDVFSPLIAFNGDARFTISIPHPNESRSPEDIKGKLCENCQKIIPLPSYLLHTNYCIRHTIRCHECGEIFAGQSTIPTDHWHCSDCAESGTGYEDIHMAQHSPAACECGQYKSTGRDVARHKATDCGLRLITCRFCHLLVPQGEASPAARAQGLSGHEDDCGGRTAECPYCNNPIRLKSLAAHIDGHEARKKARVAPQLCSNQICPQPRDDDKNPLSLCSLCFGPLYSGQHDPDRKLLKSRLERKYILQLTRGCGKGWCQNPYCATSIGRSMTMKDCMSTVVDILNSEKHWLCVDEARTRKAMFVNLSEDQSFDRGWRGMAISRCSTELEAQKWLERNAPRLNE